MTKDNIKKATTKFIYGIGQISVDTDGIISYYKLDELGSISQIYDATGNVKVTINYDEFGNIANPEDVSTGGNIFSYTGHVYDSSTGLYYAKARYYDASVGRFISEDSYRGDISNSITLNLYTYGNNNPVRYTDPSGNIAISAGTVFLISAAGTVIYVSLEYLSSPEGKKAIKDGAVAVYNGRVIAGKAVTKAAKDMVVYY